MTLAEIEDQLERISERWRSPTAAEQRRELVELDELLGQLDTDLVAADTVDEVRGRIEIPTDEIEIRLGIEPPPITGLSDSDFDFEVRATRISPAIPRLPVSRTHHDPEDIDSYRIGAAADRGAGGCWRSPVGSPASSTGGT